MKRGLLAIAALVAVVVAAFLGWGGRPGDVERSGGAPQHTASTEPADAIATGALAASPAAAAPTERRALDPRFAPVERSVATSGGARHWSELLAPIDIATRAPVADATLVFFDASGARRERPLDGPIDQRDLLPGVLGVVDGPTHVARPFLPNDFASRAPEPLTVELRPSAALHIVADMSIDLSQRPIEYSIESATSSSTSTSDEDRAAIDVGRRLRELLHGDLDASARAQRVVALTTRREPAALPQFDLARTPDPSFGAHTRLTLPDRLPWSIDDLPTGVQIDVHVRLAKDLRVARDGDFNALDELRSLSLEPASTSRLAIERDAFGTVRGRLGDFVDGDHELWIEPERAAPNAPRVARSVNEKGEFDLKLVPAGRMRLSARWTTTSGAVAEYTSLVDVPIDDVTDVGVLRPESSQPRCRVVVALAFTIDGADAAPFDTRLRSGTWTVELHRPDAFVDDDAPLRSVTGRLGEVPVFESVMPGRYQLVPRYTSDSSHAAVVLLPSFTSSAAIDVAENGEHPLVLALLEHHRTTIRFAYESGADLDALIVRVRRSGGARDFAGLWDRTQVHDIGDGAPQEFLLARGTWIVEARRGSDSTAERASEPDVHLVGHREFAVGAGADAVVTLELTPACTIEFARDFANRDLPLDATMPFLFGAESIHIPEPAAPDAPTWVFTGLLPDTEYTLEHLGRTFRTGAPGTVTRIES